MGNKENNGSSNVVPARWNQIFTENLRKRLKDFDWNASKLAKEMGADNTTVGHWINGVRMPSGDYTVLLAETLECSMDWLFKGVGPEPGPPGQKIDQDKPPPIYKVEDHNGHVAAPDQQYDPHGGWKPRPEMQDEDHNILGKAFEIIRSKSIYSVALKANINAFFRAMMADKEIIELKNNSKIQSDKIIALEKRLDDLEKKSDDKRSASGI